MSDEKEFKRIRCYGILYGCCRYDLAAYQFEIKRKSGLQTVKLSKYKSPRPTPSSVSRTNSDHQIPSLLHGVAPRHAANFSTDQGRSLRHVDQQLVPTTRTSLRHRVNDCTLTSYVLPRTATEWPVLPWSSFVDPSPPRIEPPRGFTPPQP